MATTLPSSMEDVPLTETWRGPNTAARLDTIKIGKLNTDSKRKLVEDEHKGFLIWPWSKKYRYWWGLTVLVSVITVFTEPYAVAFPVQKNPGFLKDTLSIIEFLLASTLFIDMILHFFKAYYDTNDHLVTNKKQIAVHYLKGLFWLDLAGIFPTYYIALEITGQTGKETSLASYLALLRLIKLVRLYRLKELFDILQYNPHISLLMLTLVRNMGFAIIWSHLAACIFYFTASLYDFNGTTWIGEVHDGMTQADKYITSLYWSVTTFTTVGFGDFSPSNEVEQILVIIYMMLNLIAHAWIVGSITLLIVKQDRKTGEYRDAIQTLRSFAKLHDFPRKLEKKLRGQLQLQYDNKDVSDENILCNFPAETRRKVLRRLYLPSLTETKLMRGIRQHFVDSFLTKCKVEIFRAGEEILQHGSMGSELYLVVAGSVELVAPSGRNAGPSDAILHGGMRSIPTDCISCQSVQVNSGEFINSVCFLTETPQSESVRTVTVCKTLSMSRDVFRVLAEEHPASVNKLFQNLLESVEEKAKLSGQPSRVSIATNLPRLRAGSMYEEEEDDDDGKITSGKNASASVRTPASLTAVRDLVHLQMMKMKEDQTTRFLLAAARGDTETITHMCDQGFDPNSAGYDQKTALIVSATKGNTPIVEAILRFGANPNLVDIHGSSALYEATRNGHDEVVELLLKYDAKLEIAEADSLFQAFQAIHDRNLIGLRRLLKAGLPVNVGDYDKRRPIHIAAVEGSLPYVQLLIEFGADPSVKDRWGKTAEDLAQDLGSTDVLDYLWSLRNLENSNMPR